MFIEEKPMKSCNMYNKKVSCSLLDNLVPFFDTGFDICNNYNLMVTIKIQNNNMSESGQNISYQIDKFQGIPTIFRYFVTQLVRTGFLVSSHILVLTMQQFIWQESKRT